MATRVNDLMRRDPVVVSPSDTAVDVERCFIERGIGGAPVVQGGKLVGVISRSDLVRQSVVEQALAEMVSDYYRDPGVAVSEAEVYVDAEHLQSRPVAELMSTRLITVAPDDDVASAARTMLEHRIHRVPVVEGDRVVGVLTSHDLLRVVAAQV